MLGRAFPCKRATICLMRLNGYAGSEHRFTGLRVYFGVWTLSQIVSLQRGGIAASLAYLVLLGLSTALVSPPLENILRDVMMVSISPFTYAPPNIVVVSITEQTLANFPYRSPLDRGFLADIVARIELATLCHRYRPVVRPGNRAAKGCPARNCYRNRQCACGDRLGVAH